MQISDLSGGEKARLALLKLMLSGANVLVLDEPTNHLDIESKEIFEEAVMEFPGTCIIVSHDRYFLNRVPTRIVELTEEGIENYLGTYDYYVEKKQSQIRSGKKYLESMSETFYETVRSETGRQTGAGDTSENNLSSAEKRRLQKEKESGERRLKRMKEQLEKEIGILEEDINGLEIAVCLKENMTDHKKLAEISEALNEKRQQLDEKYEKWLELQE